MDSRIVYVNGEFLKEKNAKLSVFDRGFLFADAVYEVTAVLDSKLVDWNGHVKRLKRSLAELKMHFYCLEFNLYRFRLLNSFGFHHLHLIHIIINDFK